MRGSSLLPLIAGLYFPCIGALSLHKRDVPAVLDFPIERIQAAHPLRKRDIVDVSVLNTESSYYLLNLTLGTPAQKFSLALDTGSSDIWVNTANSSLCSGSDAPCNAYGLYNYSASSTYETVGTSINITYAGGTNAYGPYVTDKLTVGNATIDKMQFAIAESSNAAQGIVGIGYQVSTYQSEYDHKEYANLPQALVDSGAINSAAYSVWLNGLEATSGSVLFGGVNKAQYQGELQTLPIVPVYGEYMSLAIALTGVSVETDSDSNSYTQNLPLSVSLDTGSAFTELPEALVTKIYEALGATYDENDGMPYIDCDTREKDYNVTYSFSGATVTVGMSQLIFDGTEPDFPKGDCVLGLVPSEPGVNLLGDTFLRSAYVVYDLANNEISLANTNLNPGDDEILEIGTGTDSVPGATLVPSAVSSATGNGVATATGGVRTVTEAATATSGSTESTGGSSASRGSSAEATSTSSKGMAVAPTSKPIHLLSGLAGAGLLLAL
ncbi:acid protease [Aspergillus heteromorphus CBS 117.55]|uniref:Probable aspartic-type endopeptidase OPSB n=1 Tax=Aspergillus heteromorphus CBS 117.55 TaxID=1448321 RepID=A0A317WRI3_9EURO|nr:acid protease [Aspergillus heteromorphus CBS 117.55]PWY86780.1 acid protease [Aspergillus heteromorphus CBS 117.55]